MWGQQIQVADMQSWLETMQRQQEASQKTQHGALHIALEGNLASGKSVHLRRLAMMGHEVADNQCEKWPSCQFIEDMPRYTLPMHLCMLIHMARQGRQSGDDQQRTVLHERHPGTVKNVTWKMQCDAGFVRKEDDVCFQQAYQELQWTPQAIIMLEKSPENCLRDASSRCLQLDEAVTLPFLKRSHACHEKMIYDMEQKAQIDVYRIDANQSFDQVFVQLVTAIIEIQHDHGIYKGSPTKNDFAGYDLPLEMHGEGGLM